MLWSQERNVIEWARNRTKEDSKVLYQCDKERPNLYSILNIASVVPKGKVYVDC